MELKFDTVILAAHVQVISNSYWLQPTGYTGIDTLRHDGTTLDVSFDHLYILLSRCTYSRHIEAPTTSAPYIACFWSHTHLYYR